MVQSSSQIILVMNEPMINKKEIIFSYLDPMFKSFYCFCKKSLLTKSAFKNSNVVKYYYTI